MAIKAVPYKHYKVVERGSWDADESVRRIRLWARKDKKKKVSKENMNWRRYREGFGTYDPDNEENYGGYGYPHHDVVNGRLVTSTAGIATALGFLDSGKMGEDTRKALRQHLVKHYRDAGMKPPSRDDMTYTELFDMYKQSRDSEITTRVMLSELDEMDAMKTRFNAAVPGVAEAFLFELFPSNQAMDSYGTRMSSAVLDTYKRNALDGVPFLNSHNSWELPLGYSYDATFVGVPVDETPLFDRNIVPTPESVNLFDQGKTLATWDYMLPGHYPNGRNKVGTDDIITSMRGRTLRDVSVGFGNNLPKRIRYICGLTGKLMGYHHPDDDRYSPYIPLIKDKESGLLAFAWVHDARMLEHSGVWKGATPGAVVGQARSLVDRLDGEEREFLEELWETSLREKENYLMSEVMMDGEEERQEEEGQENMPEVNEERVSAVESSVAGLLERVNALAESVDAVSARFENLATSEDVRGVTESVKKLTSKIEDQDRKLTALRGDVDANLQKLADDAAKTREQLVEDVVQSRIRAFGQQENIGDYRERISAMTNAQLEQEKEDNERVVKALFNAGRTIGKTGNDEVQQPVSDVPVDMYANS